nr:hypothetical protein [Burkholderia plantarii]
MPTVSPLTVPPAFENVAAVAVSARALSTPPSLANVPLALAVSALPAVTLPPLPLASEPARTLPLPVASITPPVLVNAPPAATLRSCLLYTSRCV